MTAVVIDPFFNHNWVRSNTSTQDKHQKFVLKIYPNPTQEIITVSISNYSGEIRTKVFDLIEITTNYK